MIDRKRFFDEFVKSDVSKTVRNMVIPALWFLEVTSEEDSHSCSDIADLIKQEGLRENPRATRIKEYLSRDRRALATGRRYKLSRQARMDLDEKFAIYSNPQPAHKSTHQVYFRVPEKYKVDRVLTALYAEANITYFSGCWNSCAVIMRRIMEISLIDLYLRNSLKNKIQKSGDFNMLDSILGEAKSGSDFSFSRNSKRDFYKIKELGDKAAHSRSYLTKSENLDEIKLTFETLMDEISQIQPDP